MIKKNTIGWMIFRKPLILVSGMETKHYFHTGSSEYMETLPDNSVDLIVTSPPYPMIEMWDKQFIEWDGEIGKFFSEPPGPEPSSFSGGDAWEQMHRCLDRVWQECGRVLKPSSFVCINIGDAVRTLQSRFRLYPNHARIMQYFENSGYDALPFILWRKSTNAPNKFMGSGMLPTGAYVTLEHEYILIFRKGPKRDFSSQEEKELRRESAVFWEERNTWYSDLWNLGGTAQNLKTEPRDRSGAFPWELAYRLISMYSLRGDTVLDPFGGTGSTALASAAACRNSVSFELEPALSGFAFKRLLSGKEDLNRRIKERLVSHIRFTEVHREAGHTLGHTNKEYGFPVKTSQEKEIRFYELESISPSENRGLQGQSCLCISYRPAKRPARQQLLDF